MNRLSGSLYGDSLETTRSIALKQNIRLQWPCSSSLISVKSTLHDTTSHTSILQAPGVGVGLRVAFVQDPGLYHQHHTQREILKTHFRSCPYLLPEASLHCSFTVNMYKSLTQIFECFGFGFLKSIMSFFELFIFLLPSLSLLSPSTLSHDPHVKNIFLKQNWKYYKILSNYDTDYLKVNM